MSTKRRPEQIGTDRRGHGDKRARKWELAIASLLTAPSIREAAKVAGVACSTLHEWLADPAFKAALEAARRRVLDEAVLQLQGSLTEAVTTLRRNLTCARPNVEVMAARAIWDLGMQQAQLDALAAAVQDLERRIDAAGRE